jgi:protein translocase SecG subunit
MTYIEIALVLIAAVLVVVVLAQVRGGGLSGIFGGGGESTSGLGVAWRGRCSASPSLLL